MSIYLGLPNEKRVIADEALKAVTANLRLQGAHTLPVGDAWAHVIEAVAEYVAECEFV